MKRNWVLSPEIDAKAVTEEFKIHPAIATILLRRGLKNSSEIFNFLNPSLLSLQDPFVFQDMQKAVDRVRLAISRAEKILIYGDYDVDGITGSAILYPVLKKMGADVEAYIPHRLNEGYGLNRQALERLLKEKYTLVITVDNGITGTDEIAFLNEKGVDSIIVDHHVPKGAMPPAFAILSAAIGDKLGDANLAACGVAFKFAWALLGRFEEVKDYLDLVALGTIADMAPVMGDNRILLKHGLAALSKTKRPGLGALIDGAKISRASLSYRDIAFGLGPRINASGRMGSPANAFKLLVTDNLLEAQNLAQLLEEGNQDRKRVESQAFEEALERVERDELAPNQRILVLDDPNWHVGVLGIVAARLVERYRKPAIVISIKDGQGKGSGRSVPGFSLFHSVARCEDLFENFGGHEQALGLTIRQVNIPIFRKRLNEESRVEAGLETARDLFIDGELTLSEINLKFLQDLDRLAPFGPGNKKPLFVSRRVQLRGQAKRRGADTLAAWVTDDTGKTTCEAVAFRAYERWAAQGSPRSFDAVYQPTLNKFNGISTIQLELEDWASNCGEALSPLFPT